MAAAYSCSQEPHGDAAFYGPDGGCAECGYQPPARIRTGPITSAAAVRAARESYDLLGEHLRATILAAIADGESVAEIARAAGLTRQRIYQIRDENLSDPRPTVTPAP